ncbi:Glycoside hydrolase, superfamily [Mycena venus]|uniref:Glycoside hydrolase, superfamily n=1 Tax=Mycena venus TaxID=2733690 RepID=A0A8H7CHG9_9AGAR|nr:Glycoside hydrolase, superfamily [Mycena venus]
MTLVSPQALPEGPQLTPELVAHLLDCFDTMPPVMNPLIISTSIKTAIRTVSFQLSLLPPQQRVLAMCMIALAARTSFHEAILGPGPRPQSFTDVLFFTSQTDVRACGVRRADACHALHAAALAAAWENGIMLQVSNENAASCYLLDMIETSGMSRPWAVAYFSHLRALATTWITSVTPRYEPHWAAVFMGEALLSTKSRKPVLVTHEDQLLFCGAEPPSAEELLMSLEGSINKPGAGILFRAMMPLARRISYYTALSATLENDHARLRPLSESAVLQFLSSLSLIHAILSNLLARAETLLTPEPPQQMSFVFETLSVDSILRGCVYALTIGFTGLVLPLHFELEMRANTDPDNVPSTHARERMDLLRTQVRDMVGVAVRELARMIRHLPTLINVPFPGVLDYAEFALNQLEAQPVVDPERVRDLATVAFSASLVAAVTLVEADGVPTSSGEIIGHPASSRPAVMEFLGIPFARPPKGELRFAPPVAFEDKGVVNATTFTANFDRIVGKILGQGGIVGEDCLTLNIWAKQAASSSPKSTEPRKAVMVFFYGGRFAIGGTNNSIYNGQYLADSEDVVVVTVKSERVFSYRTNIFGFPGAPNATQNLGLLDQRFALEWIRTNVAAFAGDPTRITIFGQSAGSVSVDYHSFAFTHDPIAAGFISHSGTAFSFIPNTAELAAQYWRNATAAVGCASGNGDEDDEEIMQCMRGKNFSDILAAGAQVVAVGNPAMLAAPAFQPTVDNITVFADYAALSAAGKFAKLPYLLGNLDNEAGWYRVRGFTGGLNMTDSQWSVFNAEAFTCATSQTASFRAKAGVPTWRYRYFGDWNNLRLYDCCPGSGAYHTSDLEMVFGTAEDIIILITVDPSQTDTHTAEYSLEDNHFPAKSWDLVPPETNQGRAYYSPISLLQVRRTVMR